MDENLVKAKALIADVKKMVDAGNPALKDEIRKSVSEALELTKSRKGQFGDNDGVEPKSGLIMKSLSKRDRETESGERILKIQAANDDMYLLSKLLRIDPRALNMFKDFRSSELSKAMYEGAGYGSDWIPTGFSADLINRVYLELKVASLFPRIPMPNDPYKFPVKSAGATVYKLAESTTDTEATLITPTNVATTNVTLTAQKIGCRVNFSEELNEDSIIPILPMLKEDIAISMAQGIENTIINGDNTAHPADSNIVAGSNNVLTSWLGLRQAVNSGAKVSINTFNAENFRAIRKAMLKYGVNPNNLAVICGISGYIQLLGLRDSANNPLVTTLEKYGPNATIVTGELAKIDGMPVIVSEFVPQNLNASGVYDGTTTNTTVILLVYRNGWIIGDRRAFTLKTWENIQTDQTILVSTQRLDFERRLVSTELFTGLGYNLAA